MEHNYLAGNAVCDQMHDGLGFVTNHGAETMQFEQSLQVSTVSGGAKKEEGPPPPPLHAYIHTHIYICKYIYIYIFF